MSFFPGMDKVLGVCEGWVVHGVKLLGRFFFCSDGWYLFGGFSIPS